MLRVLERRVLCDVRRVLNEYVCRARSTYTVLCDIDFLFGGFVTTRLIGGMSEYKYRTIPQESSGMQQNAIFS